VFVQPGGHGQSGDSGTDDRDIGTGRVHAPSLAPSRAGRTPARARTVVTDGARSDTVGT
jgi:hypothetical protein